MEVRARLIAGLLLLLLGAWVLHSFLPLLAWAVLLAITTWPIYQYLLAVPQLHNKAVWSSVLLTLLMGMIIIAPLTYGVSRLLTEAQSLAQMLNEAQKVGLAPPEWLNTVPIIGHWLSERWTEELGTASAAKATLHGLGTGSVLAYTKDLAGQLFQRFIAFLTTLLLLFFVYLHGESLGKQVLASSERLFGAIGIRYLRHAALAVRATVNGMVLIGLVKGLLLGVAYALAGLSHPAILGALTGLFAMIPYAAKLIFSSCALVLLAEGHGVTALILFSYGMVLTLLADNYVRPILIGNAMRLPFVWTLLGIFGGMETFGLLGLFLGPTLMAILMSIWRDWLDLMAQNSEV
ncbi:MAG: AI-2E family transporter [Methylococcaceae bacterium]